MACTYRSPNSRLSICANSQYQFHIFSEAVKHGIRTSLFVKLHIQPKISWIAVKHTYQIYIRCVIA